MPDSIIVQCVCVITINTLRHMWLTLFFFHFISHHQFSAFLYTRRHSTCFFFHNKICIIFFPTSPSFFIIVGSAFVCLKPANGIQTGHNRLSKSHGRSEIHLNTAIRVWYRFFHFCYLYVHQQLQTPVYVFICILYIHIIYSLIRAARTLERVQVNDTCFCAHFCHYIIISIIIIKYRVIVFFGSSLNRGPESRVTTNIFYDFGPNGSE